MTRQSVLTAAAAAILAVAGLAMADGARAAPKDQFLFFPLIAEAPEPMPAEVQKGELAFVQHLRPVAAVRTRAPLDVPLDKGKRTFTVPAGSMFIQALTEADLAYCYAAVERPDSFFHAIGDIGVCLRDTNGDHNFDLQIVTDPFANRVRTPFEIKLSKKDRWTPVAVAYEDVPVGEIPKAKIQVSWSHGKALLRTGGWTSMHVCWPEVLVAPTQKNGDRKLCGQLLWPGEYPESRPEYYGQKLKSVLNQPEAVVWGPYKATVTRVSDDRARYVMDSFLRPGPVVGYMAGRWAQIGSQTYQVSIYQFRELDAVPTSALEVMLGMIK